MLAGYTWSTPRNAAIFAAAVRIAESTAYSGLDAIQAELRRIGNAKAADMGAAESAVAHSGNDVQRLESNSENRDNSKDYTYMHVCTNEAMPGTGFEPARAFAHQHLKLARLPISPPGRYFSILP